MTSGCKSFVAGNQIRCVFNNLNLSLETGTCLALLGPNAAGKSTLLKTLLGLEPLTAGKVELRLTNNDVLATVMQDYRSQLLPWATVEKNLLLPLGGSRAPSTLSEEEFLRQAAQTFEAIGYQIPMNKVAGTLSGGQQQVLVLVRASLFQPNTWILDEPASAVDLTRREGIYRIFDQCNENGTSIVLVSHSIDEIVRLGDRVVIFNEDMSIIDDISIDRQQGTKRGEFAASVSGRDLRQQVVNRLLLSLHPQ